MNCTFYELYLEKRWGEGARSALGLFRELKERGYTGSSRPVFRWVRLSVGSRAADRTASLHPEKVPRRLSLRAKDAAAAGQAPCSSSPGLAPNQRSRGTRRRGRTVVQHSSQRFDGRFDLKPCSVLCHHDSGTDGRQVGLMAQFLLRVGGRGIRYLRRRSPAGLRRRASGPH